MAMHPVTLGERNTKKQRSNRNQAKKRQRDKLIGSVIRC
jgi:hypothetical protein